MSVDGPFGKAAAMARNSDELLCLERDHACGRRHSVVLINMPNPSFGRGVKPGDPVALFMRNMTGFPPLF